MSYASKNDLVNNSGLGSFSRGGGGGGDLLGDVNGDGIISSADVPLFIQALTNRAAYGAHGFGVAVDTIGDMTFTRNCSSVGPLDSTATVCVGDASAVSFTHLYVRRVI